MLKQVLTAAAVSAALVGTSLAADVAVGAKLSTLGIGIEAATPIRDGLNARMGVNWFNYSRSQTESDISYDVDLQLLTVGALLDWHPWNGGFRLTGGAMYNGNNIELDAKPAGNATYTINNVTYTAAQVGSLKGELEFNRVAPYIGIGYGQPFKAQSRFSFGMDLGVMFHGKPDVSLDVTCGAGLSPAQCTQLRNDVAIERAELQDDVNSFRYYPVIALGFMYRF